MCGETVSVLASNAENRGFEPGSDQTIDYKSGICSFMLSAEHYGLRTKTGMDRNQHNVL